MIERQAIWSQKLLWYCIVEYFFYVSQFIVSIFKHCLSEISCPARDSKQFEDDLIFLF